MKEKIVPALLLSILLFSCTHPEKANDYDCLYGNLEFEMPVIAKPSFPATEVSILRYGGVGDGVTLNTRAFDDAMQALSDLGGGTLTVPFGVWYTGPIVFRSNINLHLEKGALILFSSDFDLYPLLDTSFEGLDTKRCQSPVSGRDLTNIAITGSGAINGSGQAWRPLKRAKVTEAHWAAVVKSGGVLSSDGQTWYPSEKSRRGEMLSERNLNVPREPLSVAGWDSVKDFMRPVMVSFVRCRNVLLEGALFENSPCWTLHPLMCENVIVDNVLVRNPPFAQNGDGIDLESCRNSIIANSVFDVGDDAICIKSGKDEDGRRRGIPTENLIVYNCKVFNGHGGFVVGSEMSGGVRNVSVHNCQFLGTDVGLRFKSARGRGGVVENIFIDGIGMFDIATESLLFDLYYGGKSTVEALCDAGEKPVEAVAPEVTEKTPVFRNIHIRNLVSRNARRAMYFNGLPEMNIDSIRVEDAVVSAKTGAEISESQHILFRNVTILPERGPALLLNNVKDVEISSFHTSDLPAVIQLTGTQNARIRLPESIQKEKIREITER
ncbi:MAG: glycoside hydrolase family 28 protein [Tannerella sp.]|jgi:polygalacturonase|nr:glycoside hydrolase family 28 protein [Tannerella sp.]